MNPDGLREMIVETRWGGWIFEHGIFCIWFSDVGISNLMKQFEESLKLKNSCMDGLF